MVTIYPRRVVRTLTRHVVRPRPDPGRSNHCAGGLSSAHPSSADRSQPDDWSLATTSWTAGGRTASTAGICGTSCGRTRGILTTEAHWSLRSCRLADSPNALAGRAHFAVDGRVNRSRQYRRHRVPDSGRRGRPVLSWSREITIAADFSRIPQVSSCRDAGKPRLGRGIPRLHMLMSRRQAVD